MRLAVAGPVAGVVGGILYVVALTTLPFGGVIFAALLGFAMGRTVRWAARGQTQQPFRGIALGLAVVAVAVGLVVATGTPIPRGLFSLLAYAASAWFANRGVSG